MGMNGPCSFRSLLLGDEEAVDEPGAQFLLPGEAGAQHLLPDLGVVGDALNKHGAIHGRESFKSLLLDDCVDFLSAQSLKEGNGNHVRSCLLSSSSTAVAAAALMKEEPSRFLIESPRMERLDEGVVIKESRPSRKRSVNRGETARRQTTSSKLSSGASDVQRFTDDKQQQAHDSSALPALGEKRQLACGRGPLSRKKKQKGSSTEVQKLLDSIVTRQEAFFAKLLESMERKEATRERIREEKEETWRAEERFQSGVFNNAMIALTKEILGDSSASKTKLQFNKKRKSDKIANH